MSSKLKLHARRRAARFGELESLLAAALAEQAAKRPPPIPKLKGISPWLHESFANPENWEERGVVQIIYTDERTGISETIGMFQELVHRRVPARKLLRIENDGATQTFRWRSEVYTDPYLVRGKPDPCPPVPPQNTYERQAVRDYLARRKQEEAGLTLSDFIGSKPDAAKLLKELHDMQLTAEVLKL